MLWESFTRHSPNSYLPTHSPRSYERTCFSFSPSPHIYTNWHPPRPQGLPFKMFKARDTKRAIQTLKHSRTFSSTPARPAVSPYRRATQAASTKALKDSSKRPQSTAAAATQEPRPHPAPAFNRDDWNDVQPLRPYRQPEMDHSFVGMKGGEIFHEMMLRQGVKHICAFSSQLLSPSLCNFSICLL